MASLFSLSSSELDALRLRLSISASRELIVADKRLRGCAGWLWIGHNYGARDEIARFYYLVPTEEVAKVIKLGGTLIKGR